MALLNIGDSAPAFAELEALKGKKVVIYFYPKDDTPGCTTEACNLRDNYEELKKQGYEILGVSPDDAQSHDKFTAKFNLPFKLVADTEKTIVKAYGAWGPKNLFGKITDGLLRSTFVVDENGKIAKVIAKVKTDNHTKQILA